jgi:Zn-finger nucleic acid-binding protein
LATVACPFCFGMMFAGAKFCSHCGAKGDRNEVPGGEMRLCPRCKVGMKAANVGTTKLLECGTCEGIWVDVETLQDICSEREKQAAVLGMPSHPEQGVAFEEKVRYVPCPVCLQLMNRVNFAHCSRVIVDVCKAHGTWFDKDELRRTVEFIRGGGLEKARAQQLQEIKDEQKMLEATRRLNSHSDPMSYGGHNGELPTGVASTAIDLLFELLR